MKTHSIVILLFTSMLSVLGCGSDKEPPPYQMVEQVEPTTVITTEEVTTATAELISTPEFSLTATTDLQVNLPISPSETISYFINICTNFSSEKDEITIDYDSCKLRAMLNTTQQQYTLYLSTTETQLIAQIWPIEDNAKPTNIYWNITELGNNWQISF